MTALAIVLAVVVALGLWIRLAPSDPNRWHVKPMVTKDAVQMGSASMRIENARLADLDVIARATPRTTVLAGTVDSGMVTYVTRSAVIGFPDYTTVARAGDDLVLFARLRFGRSDFGVNAARLNDWRDRLSAAQ